MIVLVTGPVRAGKSAFAARLAAERGGRVTYVATARLDPADGEFAARIAHHRRDRPAGWATVETAGPPPVDLPGLVAGASAGEVLLVDSVGTWLAGRLLELEAAAGADAPGALAELEGWAEALLPALRSSRADVVLVSEETGWGLVPEYVLGRLFRDALGRLNQRLAGAADAAYLVVAGYALDLKRAGRPVD